MTYAYPIIIKPQPDGYYLAEAPDLPGIVVGGDTLPESLATAADRAGLSLSKVLQDALQRRLGIKPV